MHLMPWTITSHNRLGMDDMQTNRLIENPNPPPQVNNNKYLPIET
jgi:hypothetical protein